MLPRYTIKSWVALAKQGIRKLHDSLELPSVDKLTSTDYSSLVYSKVPVRANIPNNAANNLYSLQRRNAQRYYSTVNQNAGYSRFQSSIFKNVLNFVFFRAPSRSFHQGAAKFNYSNAFRGPYSFAARNSFANSVKFSQRNGIFPSTLYKSFGQTNGRYFSSYSSNATREAVQNLTAASRAFFNNGSGKLNSLNVNNTQSQSFIPNSTSSTKNVETVLGMIQDESSRGNVFASSFVNFKVQLPRLSAPTVNFLDEDYIQVLNDEIAEYQKEIEIVKSEIKAVFENFGCLPIRIVRNDKASADSIIFRIYFANHDVEMVEGLLKDALVTRGVVYEANMEEDLQGAFAATTLARSSSSAPSSSYEYNTDLDFMSCIDDSEVRTQFSNDEVGRAPSVPYSLISDSQVTPSEEFEELGSDLDYEDLFYPVLSSSVRSRSLQLINAPVAA